MYFKNIDDNLLTEASHILWDADNVTVPIYQEVTEHAVRRFIQRATKGDIKSRDRLKCNVELSRVLSKEYKRNNYMGKTVDDKHGVTYWYRGCSKNGKVKYLIPQDKNGCIKTVFNWGFDNDKVKFLKCRIIQLTEKLKNRYTTNSRKDEDI